MRMIPWAHATKDELKNVKGVCLDIDETLSTRGKLTAEAFSALWKLKDSGFVVVPVTGRPAGWCDHIARFWPVDAVVGENGAFTLFMEAGKLKRINTPGAPNDHQARLKKLGAKIQKKFKDAKWASDQAYREFDLAIDVCEDVKPWPKNKVQELIALCEDAGAHVKLSSIHVNTWFGNYDKAGGLKHWLVKKGGPGLNGHVPTWDELLFIGDSPNDEPLFASFQHSVGVANLAEFSSSLKHPPRWITSKESGAGFAEMATRLVDVRFPSQLK